ncbi:hypothetical protein SESBI_13136 [Sesbania bispinosa]|nr:hypothetical protein SESBI_13136 [Sesbania bispinosa]
MDSWKNIQLTDEEETDVVQIVDAETISSIDHERVSQGIICKLWTLDSYNAREFKNTMMNLWKTRNGMEIWISIKTYTPYDYFQEEIRI